jgi:hypothetical protein
MPISAVGGAVHASATTAGTASAARPNTDALILKQIAALQKQLKDLGEKYADEVKNPRIHDPMVEQEYLQNIQRQMEAIKAEIEALERSLTEKQNTAQTVVSTKVAAGKTQTVGPSLHASTAFDKSFFEKLGTIVNTKA